MISWRLYTLLDVRCSKLWCVLVATGVVGCLDPLVEDPGVNGGQEQSEPQIPEVPGAAIPGAAAPNGGTPTVGGNETPIDAIDPAQSVAPGVTNAPQPTEGEPNPPSATPTAVAPAPITVTPGPDEPSTLPTYGETISSDETDGNQQDTPEDDDFAPVDGGVEAGSRLLIRAQQVDAGDAATAGEGGS